MRADELLFPGYTGPYDKIRRDLAFAISRLETAKGLGAPDKPAFAAFLLDAAQRTPGYVAPALPATQAVVSTGQVVTIGATKYTFTVAGGVITNIVAAPV